MHKALDELKIQAKILLKSLKENQPNAAQRLKRQYKSYQEGSVYQPKLKHCQQVVACESGFSDWQHAHHVLNACEQNRGIDKHKNMGKLWHSHSCDALLNNWFNNYPEAALFHSQTPNSYLFPYNHQFVVVTQDYVNALGLGQLDQTLWDAVKKNLVASYPSDPWDKIAMTKLKQ